MQKIPISIVDNMEDGKLPLLLIYSLDQCYNATTTQPHHSSLSTLPNQLKRCSTVKIHFQCHKNDGRNPQNCAVFSCSNSECQLWGGKATNIRSMNPISLPRISIKSSHFSRLVRWHGGVCHGSQCILWQG